MRTTLDIADDVIFAAKEIAKRESKSVGQVISDLARRAFATGLAQPYQEGQAGGSAPRHVSERLAAYGIEPMPSRGAVISNQLIDRLRDQEGI